jgi:hypothetical protein
VNAPARKAALKQDSHDLLQKKILKLTKKICQTTQPAKKAVLQTKLLKRLAALADQVRAGCAINVTTCRPTDLGLWRQAQPLTPLAAPLQENQRDAACGGSSAAAAVAKQSPAGQGAPYSYSKPASGVLRAAPRTAADVAKHASRAERFCGSEATEPADEVPPSLSWQQPQAWLTNLLC